MNKVCNLPNYETLHRKEQKFVKIDQAVLDSTFDTFKHNLDVLKFLIDILPEKSGEPLELSTDARDGLAWLLSILHRQGWDCLMELPR